VFLKSVKKESHWSRNNYNRYLFSQMDVALEHAYIDGTKLEANANKYSWVWKKSCIKSRNKVFEKLSALLKEMNETMAVCRKAVFEVRQEYAIEHMEYILHTFLEGVGRSLYMAAGSGKRPTSGSMRRATTAVRS